MEEVVPVYEKDRCDEAVLSERLKSWRKKTGGRLKAEAKAKTPQVSPYMSQWHTYGMHRYRTANEDSTVYYIDETRGIRKKIVDRRGNIIGFPGIKREDFWIKEVFPQQPQAADPLLYQILRGETAGSSCCGRSRGGG